MKMLEHVYEGLELESWRDTFIDKSDEGVFLVNMTSSLLTWFPKLLVEGLLYSQLTDAKMNYRLTL